MKKRWTTLAGLCALVATAGCGSGDSDGDDALPTSPPTALTKIAGADLTNAGAVAASPDGSTFYVAAYDDAMRPAVIAVDAQTGSQQILHAGAPLFYPTDLSVACDGSQIFVADFGQAVDVDELGDPMAPVEEGGAIHVLDPAGGPPTALAVTGIGRASGIIVSADCSALFVTGLTDAGAPAVFRVALEGGAADVLHEGEPLVSPTGVHADAQDIAWVMDHEASGEGGEGALFAVTLDGDISEVATGLGMGRHGGVSLTPGGVTAVIPVRDEATGESMLITANTETGETATMPTPDLTHPTGVAAAREAAVMVVASEDGLHLATFDAQ